MKTPNIFRSILLRNLLMVSLLAHASFSDAKTASPLVDDFSDTDNNSVGIPRLFINDSSAGRSTTSDYRIAKGVLSAKGEIVPARGQPGWASSVLLLDPQGLPKDLSAFDGVRLIVRISKGNVSLSANSADVTNYDYHAAPVVAKNDGKFHEIKIPFSSMKRAWSEQTPLNANTITGLSLVAYDLQKGSFDFEVDEISFY